MKMIMMDVSFVILAGLITLICVTFISTPSVGIHKYPFGQESEDELAEGNDSDAIVTVRQNGPSYRDNFTLVPVPEQADRMVLLLLSVVVANAGISEARSQSVIGCVSKESETETGNWGAFRASRFTPSLIQVEYFVMVSEEKSLTLSGKVDPFIRDGGLTSCMRNADSGLPARAKFLEGRTIIASDTEGIVSSHGNIPGWAIAVALGGLSLIGVIALMIILCKEDAVYKEEDYDKLEDDENWDGEGIYDSEEELDNLRIDGRQQQDVDLRKIAGQRQEDVVVTI